MDLVSECEWSVQLGDMGDAETYAELEAEVDSVHHRFFGGNHDHYHDLPVHSLGDFGMAELGGVEFFFVRGAESSDKNKLIERGEKLGKQLWYEEEELPESVHDRIVDEYAEQQPSIVLSHTCPARIVPFISDYAAKKSRVPMTSRTAASRTNLLLDRLLDAHRPEFWFFGHYHHDWMYREDGVEFRCVGELSVFEIVDD